MKSFKILVSVVAFAVGLCATALTNQAAPTRVVTTFVTMTAGTCNIDGTCSDAKPNVCQWAGSVLYLDEGTYPHYTCTTTGFGMFAF